MGISSVFTPRTATLLYGEMGALTHSVMRRQKPLELAHSGPENVIISQKDTSLNADLYPSPNNNKRRNNLKPNMIVVHHTATDTMEEALKILSRPDGKTGVSTHYVIGKDGKIIQMVPEAQRAWHAGVSSWRGMGARDNDINSNSIGIELVNLGLGQNFEPAQIAALIALIKDIARRNNINLKQVVGHADVAPGRKTDPSAAFPWKTLAQNRIGIFVDPVYPVYTPPDFISLKRDDTGKKNEIGYIAKAQNTLRAIGYTLGDDAPGHFGAATEAAVKAFQLHYRPTKADGSNGVDGIVDYSTFLTLQKLYGEATAINVA